MDIIKFFPIPDLCHCGCRQIVWNGVKWKKGHNSKKMTDETKRKIGIFRKGTQLSKEHKNKISVSIQKIITPERCQEISKRQSGKNHWNYGNHWSEEVRQKIRQSLTDKSVGKNNGMYGKHHSEETRKLLSEKKKGIFEKENNPNWKGGLSFEPYCEKFTKKVRREIRNKFNNKCFICNHHQKDNFAKNGKIRALSVHHVYYDKKEGCNGKDFALIPLCMKCHGKTNYDRNYWEKFLINKLEVIHA